MGRITSSNRTAQTSDFRSSKFDIPNPFVGFKMVVFADAQTLDCGIRGRAENGAFWVGLIDRR